MQIQFRANAETPRAAFQTQNVKAAPTTGALGTDAFQPTRPNLVVINPAQAPVPAPTGNLWGAIGAMLWNGLAAMSPAVAMVKSVAEAVGSAAQQLLDQMRPQSQPQALPQPQAQPAKPAVNPGAQARYEAAFKALDLDGNGKLEGQELDDNAMFTFGPQEAGTTAEQFTSQAALLEEAESERQADAAFERRDINGDGVLSGRELTGTTGAFSPAFDPAMEGTITRERFKSQAKAAAPALVTGKAAGEASSEARLRQMHLEVWGKPELWNPTASAWWRGQLKAVGGDWTALKAKMVAYRDDYEATMKKYGR